MAISRILLTVLLAVGYKPIELAPDYEHDKWGTMPRDIVREFRAYTVSFDGPDDGVRYNVPEWVAYEIKPRSEPLSAGPDRPYRWIDSDGSPPDESYKGSGYDRGHMCPKHHAWRLGANADWNTHTTLNACPQIPSFNRGIWVDMERLCAEWADQDKASVWVITGPVVMERGLEWIGEIPVAIPQSFFKIIVRQKKPGEVVALIYPHVDMGQKGPWRHSYYLTSVNYIELLTGLDFFTVLPDDKEEELESRVASSVWGESRYQAKK